LLFEDYAFIPPVGKILYRGRPAYVIALTVFLGTKKIMAPINVQPLTKHLRFSIRDVFPTGKIGVIALPLHRYFLLQKYSISCYTILNSMLYCHKKGGCSHGTSVF
jgi:hypothetical protein